MWPLVSLLLGGYSTCAQMLGSILLASSHEFPSRAFGSLMILSPYLLLTVPIPLDMQSFYYGGFVPSIVAGTWYGLFSALFSKQGSWQTGLGIAALVALPNLGIFIAHSLKPQ